MPPSALTNVETKEVSLVDRGAVKRRFAVRKGEAVSDEIIKACLDAPLENEAEIDAQFEKAGLDSKAKGALKGAMKILSAFKDHLSDSHLKMLGSMVGGGNDGDAEDADDDGADDDQEDAKGKPAKGKPAKAAAKKSDDSADEATNTEPEDMSKSDATADVRAELEAIRKSNTEAVTKAQAEAVELRKQLETERDMRLNREAIEKAGREFPNVANPEKMGGIIRKLEAAGLYDEVAPILKAANEQARVANLFKESGRAGPAVEEGSALETMNKQATELLKAAKFPTFEQAFLHVQKSDKGLYDRYIAETSKR